jgi:hypothetical protein
VVEYENAPRADVMESAQRALDQLRADGVRAVAYFKASCPECGERCQFVEPNVCYENMTCCGCGTDFPFTEGNYALEMVIGGPPGAAGAPLN